MEIVVDSKCYIVRYSCFSGWSELILGVPQGTVPGPLLFSIYIINNLILLTELTDIFNYDGIAYLARDSNWKDFTRRLEHD